MALIPPGICHNCSPIQTQDHGSVMGNPPISTEHTTRAAMWHTTTTTVLEMGPELGPTGLPPPVPIDDVMARWGL